MESVKNFDSFYALKIQPGVDELVKDEAAAYNWKIFTLLTGVGAFGSFFLYYLKIFPNGAAVAVAMLLMFIAGVYFSAKYSDRYIDDFKEKIIKQIITYIHPEAVYKPMGFVSKKEYKASGLFRRRFTHFDGDDYWECVCDGVAFHCSEIKSWIEDGAGVETIFKGLFFSAGLSSVFTGGTYIWTKGNVQLPATIADEHYRMFFLPEVHRVKTNHGPFNKQYSVYSTNAYEAAAIVTTGMMDHMLLLKEKLKREIVFSFVAGRCYVAVPFEEDLLEPSKKGIKNKEEFKNYFFTILLVFNIIQKLELNRLT